jgi:hypothetical protein
MATYSTGISATWNGTPFQEITELSWNYGGGPAKGRGAIWTDDVGGVSLTTLNVANVSSSQYGVRGDLVLSGGGQSLTSKAIYEGFSVQPERNGVTRFTVNFRLLDN